MDPVSVIVAASTAGAATGEEVLPAELVAVDAGTDAQEFAAARRPPELCDPGGVRTGRYTVDARGAQGVQVGDHNTQTNTFTSSPAPPA